MVESAPAVVPEAVELLRVRLELRQPFSAAHGIETTREVILVRAVLDEIQGWGECSTLSRPGYTPEYTDGAWRMLRDVLAPGLLTHGLSTDALSPSEGHPMARAALETACLDLFLRSTGLSLRSHLGGTSTELPTIAVVGLCGSDEQLLDIVVRHLDERVAGIKLKVTPETAVDHLRLVRNQWPDLPLAADANGSFGARCEDVPVDELNNLDLLYLEQPLSPDAFGELAKLSRRLAAPVALDETATSVAATTQALDAGCGQVVNVKPARVGGVGEAAALVTMCRDRGVDVFVGGMLESGVGRAAALAVASLEGCTLPTDLGPTCRYFTDDVTEPIVTNDDGLVCLPAGHGIGVQPLVERRAVMTVDGVRIGTGADPDCSDI